MAKMSKEELSERINGLDIEDELKISLMEDVTDSIGPDESEELANLKSELEDYKAKYEDVKAKYKERFLKAVESDDKEEKVEEELEEKEVINVTDI